VKDYLFPPKQLRAVRIKGKTEWIVFYRAEKERRVETLTGPTDRIEISGLAIAGSPVFDVSPIAELLKCKINAKPGFFEFKTRATHPAEIDIRSEKALRFIMAGVKLGEDYAKRDAGNIKPLTGGNLDRLMQRTLCWFLWQEFSGDAFLKKCRKGGLKPIHAAAKKMAEAGNGITPAALEKQLARLFLPIPRK